MLLLTELWNYAMLAGGQYDILVAVSTLLHRQRDNESATALVDKQILREGGIIVPAFWLLLQSG
jgi:hypothetical protein